MLDKNGFNEWAGTYDENVESSSKGYPFEGYYQVLGYIQHQIKINEDTKILDLGIGTGLLTTDLYNRGALLVGVDFSEKMILEARDKMPKATFVCYDFNDPLPKEILGAKYDYIVSSYAIHHVNDVRKIELVKVLINCLNENGKIFFADVAFETESQQEDIKNSTHEWDEDEYYMIGETISRMLAVEGLKSKYQQISICAGVLEIERGDFS